MYCVNTYFSTAAVGTLFQNMFTYPLTFARNIVMLYLMNPFENTHNTFVRSFKWKKDSIYEP